MNKVVNLSDFMAQTRDRVSLEATRLYRKTRELEFLDTRRHKIESILPQIWLLADRITAPRNGPVQSDSYPIEEPVIPTGASRSMYAQLRWHEYAAMAEAWHAVYLAETAFEKAKKAEED